ncbi:hypothetical protein P12x_005316 [Tundrisphaera lichenicola]|uniref:hypothetical protein n=1 Tax=Tundrisphaera lichenicola TaxID=2029860 RepID=UPI003EBC98E8
MPTRSLFTRSGQAFQFNPMQPDRYAWDYSSLITPREAHTEAFFLALTGEYDAQGYFANDLHVYLNCLLDDQRIVTTDLTSLIARHYATELSVYDQDQFRAHLVPRIVPHVAYYNPEMADPLAHAQELVDALYENLPAADTPAPLGTGNASDTLTSLHWFWVVHRLLPVRPFDLTLAMNSANVPERINLNELFHPVTITFSSGPTTTPRSARRDVGATLTRGGLVFDMTIVYKNPISDEIDDILAAIQRLREDVDQLQTDVGQLQSDVEELQGEVESIWDKLAEWDTTVTNALRDIDNLKLVTLGIETRIKQVQIDLGNNTGILNNIRNRISTL